MEELYKAYARAECRDGVMMFYLREDTQVDHIEVSYEGGSEGFTPEDLDYSEVKSFMETAVVDYEHMYLKTN